MYKLDNYKNMNYIIIGKLLFENIEITINMTWKKKYCDKPTKTLLLNLLDSHSFYNNWLWWDRM